MLIETSGSVSLLIVYFVFGIVILIFTPVSGWVKQNILLAEPLLSTLVGIVVSASASTELTSQTTTAHLRHVALEVARLTVAIQVLSAGCEVEISFYRAHKLTLGLFLSIVILFMCLTSSAFTILW